MKPYLGALLALCPCLMNVTMAQTAGFNYDESKVPNYTLPDPLINDAGERVASASQWMESRRSEILRHFEQSVYGPRPGKPDNLEFVVTEESSDALGGLARRKQVTVLFEGGDRNLAIHVLIYLPKNASGPSPLFVGYNFNGNHTINTDPEIHLSKSWMRKNGDGVINHRATEATRGASAKRWAVDMILKRGYGLATAYYGDVEPDHAEGWKDGIRPHYPRDAKGNPLQLEDWSAISAWAWTLSRIVDYFETDGDIDAERVALMGHSRLGKSSLWAGATDERFAITISNNSGCGGAALSRRAFGETVKRINTNFPHWFCQTFSQYNDNESELPVDQHQLIALMAPRPVYIASAVEDQWADPNGEFLSAKHAGPVYELFGKNGVGARIQPPIDTPIGDSIGYHVRSGGHDVTDYDWEQYLKFADRHFK